MKCENFLRFRMSNELKYLTGRVFILPHLIFISLIFNTNCLSEIMEARHRYENSHANLSKYSKHWITHLKTLSCCRELCGFISAYTFCSGTFSIFFRYRKIWWIETFKFLIDKKPQELVKSCFQYCYEVTRFSRFEIPLS